MCRIRARTPRPPAPRAARAAGDPALSIPLVRASGTHREAGAAIGHATADYIRRSAGAAEFDHDLILRYRGASVKHLPWVVEELDAAARAAEVDPLALFADSVHELSTFSQTQVPSHCTDIAAGPTLTADGHLLVAHNNDLSAGDENDVVAIEWKVEGEPTIFTLGLGPWISVGWNEAGLSITGNEVAPKDEGVGIPRLLQVRDVLTRTTLTDATRAILHPARASSYNWVVAQGDVVMSIEGSATAAEAIAPAEDGTLAHTNHYVHPEMLDYEASTSNDGSAARLQRAKELLADSLEEALTRTRLREILSDHESSEPLCRHGSEPGDSQTAFWCIADVTARTIMYGRGNPCDSEAELYVFS
jgi:isopenicillin-N N-acyltransferase-like protein